MKEILLVLSLPFAGTVLGAAASLFAGDRFPASMRRALLGFASGVMVAASMWSLLLPAIEEAERIGVPGWAPAVAGFAVGIGFMFLLDIFTPHQHLDSVNPEGPHSSLGRRSMLILAVTLHNIPEGMAVGVVAAGVLSEQADVSYAGALALSIGIAVQNIPEGAIISLPLRAAGASRGRSFAGGVLSGAVEPAAAVITIFAISELLVLFPYLLAFAAGAMIYVVVEELIPEAHEGSHSNVPTIGFALGFIVMMGLDIALG